MPSTEGVPAPICVYGLFWCTQKQLLRQTPPGGNQSHHRPPKQVEYVPGTTVPAVLLLAPKGLKTTVQPGRANGNFWMLPLPRARNFCPPQLPGDVLTGTPSTCLICGPQALGTRWPLLKLLAPYAHTPTAHTTPEQNQGLHTHLKQASAEDTATVAGGPSTTAEWRFHRGTWETRHPAITIPVQAKHRNTTLEAAAYQVNHRRSRVQDWQTIGRTTCHPQKAYLLRYVYGHLTQGHEGNNDYVRGNPAATEMIHQGIRVYATRRLQPSTTTPWATTEQGARPHLPADNAVPPAMPRRPQQPHLCACLRHHEPHPSGRGGAALELQTDAAG